MPPPSIVPLLPGARTLIRNGLMQNDMDAAGFKIYNLDPSSIPPANGPLPFPAVPHQWINTYDDVGRVFSATQPDLLADIAGFPTVVGQSGKFLTNNGSVLNWGNPPVPVNGIINVKDFGAIGNGIVDDWAAINAAILAGAGGITVYFPKGTYRVSRMLAPALSCSLLGDNPFQSVIRIDPEVNYPAVLIVTSGSVVQKLGFDANASNGIQPVIYPRLCFGCSNASGVYFLNCFAANSSSTAIGVVNSNLVTVRDCFTSNCGGYGIEVFYSTRTIISGNYVTQSVLSGIAIINSLQSVVSDNQVLSCAPAEFGILLADSDNSTVTGNVVQQCAIGIGVTVTAIRARQPSYGNNVSGNTVIRNYYGGIILSLANGFTVAGNTVSDNGQGGTDGITYTAEPGIILDPSTRGTGYQVGDVLTVPGAGTPAKVMVTAISTGGAISLAGIFILNPGNYSSFPANPVAVTGGHGTGAKVILTGAKLSTGGSHYVVGQVLVGNNGNYFNPMRVLVTGITGSGGAVSTFQVLDGGGYFGALPNPITFSSDAFSPEFGIISPAEGPFPLPPDSSGGFTVTPGFGLRYSKTFQGATSFGICTYGPIRGGIIGNNIIDSVRSGCGILVLDDVVAGYTGRANHLTVVANSLVDNLFSIRGKTVGGLLDTNFNVASVFANNMIDPSEGTIV